MRTMKILSCLYHVLQGIAAKHSFYSLPHFVAFIMVIILQSEESEIELNTENSSDWRKSNKIPHFACFEQNQILWSEEFEFDLRAPS